MFLKLREGIFQSYTEYLNYTKSKYSKRWDWPVVGVDISQITECKLIHSRGDQNNTVKFLTKGDNNSVDDRGLYAPGQLWLTHKDVVGRARGFLPYVGMITIFMNEYPKFKYAVLIYLGLYVLVHRD